MRLPRTQSRVAGGAPVTGDHAMHRLSVVTLLVAAAPFAPVQAGERSHYLYVVNRAHDAIVSLSAAPAGADDRRELLAGTRLAGGGEAATVEIRGEGCVHDLHVVFANGRRALYPAFDLCRARGLRVMPLPARDAQARLARTRTEERAAAD